MNWRILIRRRFYAHLAWGTVLCASYCAAGEIPWFADLPSAIDESMDSGKLVMVVDLPTPTSASDTIAQANEAFLVGSVGSQRFARHLRYHCLPVVRTVGVPSFAIQDLANETGSRGSQPRKPRFRKSQLQRPITYFCSPIAEQQADEPLAIAGYDIENAGRTINPSRKLQVIHFCVGYVGPSQLANAARWAIDNYGQASTEAGADSSSTVSVNTSASSSNPIGEFLRVAHIDACSENSLAAVESSSQLLRNSREELDVTSVADVRSLLRATLKFCENKFLTGVLDREDVPATALRSLTLSTDTDLGHLVLALSPPIRLDQLEQHCFEIVAHGQCYGTATLRIRRLDKFFRTAQSNGLGVLCCIRDSITDPVSDSRMQAILATPIVERRLHVVESVPMLEAELSAILHRRRRLGVKVPTDGELVFALFDIYGDLNATIYDSEPVAKVLSRRLEAIGRVAKRNRNENTKQ